MNRFDHMLRSSFTTPVDENSEEYIRLHKQLEHIEANPPVDELQAVLGERFTPSRAHQLMFNPELADATKYIKLIDNPPENAPEEHPQWYLQKLFMMLLDCYGIGNKPFVWEIVMKGGLPLIAKLVRSTSPDVARLAINILMAFIATFDIDWFADKPTPELVKLHIQMLRIDTQRFISDLVDRITEMNPISDDSAFACMQIMLVFISWLRFYYSGDREVLVNPRVVNVFREYSERTINVKSIEIESAKQIYDNFKQFVGSTEDGPLLGDLSIPDEMKKLVDKANDQFAAALGTPGTNAIEEDDKMSEFEKYKALGNAAFAQGNYTEAIEQYALAKAEALDSKVKNPFDISRIEGNSAAAYIMLARTTDNRPHHYEAATVHANAAIAADNMYVKGHLRLAQALIALGTYDQALCIIHHAQSICSDGVIMAQLRRLERDIALDVIMNPEKQTELYEIYMDVMKRQGAQPRDSIRCTSTTAKAKAKPENKQSAQGGGGEKSTKSKAEKASGTSSQDMHNFVLEQLNSSLDSETLIIDLSNMRDIHFRAFFMYDGSEAAVLERFIGAMNDVLPRHVDKVWTVLQLLSRVNRIEIFVMFLNQRVQAQLASCIAIVQSMMMDRKDEVEQVVKVFKL